MKRLVDLFFDGRAIEVIEEEFTLFKGVTTQEVFRRENDFLLRVEGWHTHTSSSIEIEVLG
jgi:hypothetical protein